MPKLHFLHERVELPSSCPAACGFCQLQGTWPHSEQSVIQFKPNPLDRYPLDFLNLWKLFCGGDALAYSNLKPELESIKKMGFKIAISTAGPLFLQFPLDQLAAVDLFFIPHFSKEAAANNEEMGIDQLDQVLEISRVLKVKGKWPVLVAQINRQNMADIDDWVRWAEAKELFMIFRPRSALNDLKGLPHQTYELIRYQAKKKNIFVHPFESWPGHFLIPDLPELKDCLTLEPWLAGGEKLFLAQSLIWSLLIRKIERFYSPLH